MKPKRPNLSLPTYVQTRLFQRFWIIGVLFFPALQAAHAQTDTCAAGTVINPGDFLVLGVNTNTAACGGMSGDDEVSFVCFRDIQPGTCIDFTDNGWERENPNLWGNSEGFVRAFYDGAAPIPAGTVITMAFPGFSSPENYRTIQPNPTDWLFSNNGVSANVNFSSIGDQLYFLQGGSWDFGTTPFLDPTADEFGHNASYSGRVLFGFNTRTEWLPGQANDPTTHSGLHPDVAPCFNMAPTDGTSNFISYSGPLTPADQLEWITRVGNPDNWSTYSGCDTYQQPPASIDILPSQISLSCTTCQSCNPYDEQIVFNLPGVGGPFLVEYTDGDSIYQSGTVSDGDAVRFFIESSTSFEILSVTDANGCPVFSNFGGGVTASVLSIPDSSLINDPLRLEACGTGDGTAGFNLRPLVDSLGARPQLIINWFQDLSLTTPITNLDNYISPTDTIYAQVSSDTCNQIIYPTILEVTNAPTINFTSDLESVCDGSCRRFDLVLNGTGPYQLSYSVVAPDTAATVDTLIASDTFQLVICPEEWLLTEGELEVTFLRLDDANCGIDLNESYTIPVDVTRFGRLDTLLCEGEFIQLGGRIFDETRPTGRVILPNGGYTGCDSVVDVSILYLTGVEGAIRGDTGLCLGRSTTLTLSLSGADRFNVTYTDGVGPPQLLTNIQDGYELVVNPTEDRNYMLTEIQAVESGCVFEPDPTSVEVRVSDLAIQAQAMDVFNGFGVSCADANDGTVNLSITGGEAPFDISWNTGDSISASLTGLPAGTYSAAVTDVIGCTRNSQATLESPDPIELRLQSNAANCGEEENRVILELVSGGNPPYEYSLDGTFFETITDFPVFLDDIPPGEYVVQIQDMNDCLTVDTVDLQSLEVRFIELGPDREIPLGDSLTLIAEANFIPANLSWAPMAEVSTNNQMEITVQPEFTTTYVLTAIDSAGCILKDQVTVMVDRSREVFIPTAFRPGDIGSGNEVFTIYTGDRVVAIRNFRVFDRWGSLRYEQEMLIPGDTQTGWDGRDADGEISERGVYIYTAELEYRDGMVETIGGDVMLMR